MGDEELALDDLSMEFGDVTATLGNLSAGHWPDEDLWLLAVTPAADLTAAQREFLHGHALDCRSCYRAVGDFRHANVSSVEVPTIPPALGDAMAAMMVGWQAQRVVFAITVLSGGILRVRQPRAGSAARFRSKATDYDAVEFAPGQAAEIPTPFGSFLLLLVITPTEGYSGRFSLQLKPDEGADPTDLEPLECLLLDSGGNVLGSASFSPAGFSFPKHAALDPGTYKLVLRTKAKGELIGEVEIEPDTESLSPSAAEP